MRRDTDSNTEDGYPTPGEPEPGDDHVRRQHAARRERRPDGSARQPISQRA